MKYLRRVIDGIVALDSLIALVLLFFAAGFYWQFRREPRKLTVR